MAVFKERTPEELLNPELNYFIAFDIEPTETNAKKIEEVLNSKYKTFARTVTAITTRLIEVRDDVNKVMLQDVALRKKEAEAAKKFFLARAIKMAEGICQSGYIEDIKITELAKRFFVDEKAILDGIAGLLKQGVQLKKVAAEKREVAFSNYKKIESFLRTLNKKDLYDFSGLPDSASTTDLYAAQERLYSEASKKANDAKSKATSDLSGIGKVVFKSDAARREYDIYYRTKTKVWDVLSNNADAGVRMINDTLFLSLVEALRNYAGLKPDAAEKELYAYMQNFRMTRESSDKIKIAICPYKDCGKSYVANDTIQNCPHCGKSLRTKCWNCGDVSLYVSDTASCKKCGISKKHQAIFDAAVQKFDTLIKSPQITEVSLAAAMNQLENILPQYDKVPDSLVAKKIQSAKQIKVATCPYKDCGKSYVATAQTRACPHCGKSLQNKCWNCGQVDLFISEATPCTKCGTVKKHQALFQAAMQKYDALLKSPQITEATLAAAINQMENILPRYDKAPDSFVAKTISAAKAVKIATCPYADCKKSYIASATIQNCPHCGKSLRAKCWNCGNLDIYVSDGTSCKKCGVAKKNQPVFDAAEKKFEALLKNLTVSEVDLAAALNQMENVLPQYDKVPDSFIAKTIKTAKEHLALLQKDKAARQKEAEKYAIELKKLIAAKKYFTASSLLKQLKMADPTYDVKDIEAKTQSALQNAQYAVDAANRELKAGNVETAVGHCGKAIEFCSDYTPALQLIKQHPPKAPDRLNVKVVRNTVKLEWPITGDQSSLTYTVIRKVGSVPANNEDGDVLERDLTLNMLEDTALVPATAYYYGVFASRGGVESPLTVFADPVAIFAEVIGLRQEKVSDVIRATWQLPDNVQAVEVYRKAGALPPMSRTDGELIPTDGKTAFTDAKLTEDKYSYLIVCRYQYMGKPAYSAGIKASYTPFLMPEAPQNGKVQTSGFATDFLYICDAPKNGALKLYTAARQMQLPFGQVDDMANFTKKCSGLKPIDGALLEPGKMSFSVPAGSILWLYPVVANAALYTVGEPLLLNSVLGIEGINVIEQPGSITIEGALDKNARSITAVLSTHEFVMNLDAAEDTRVCSADGFRNDDGMYISLKPGMYYITLFVEYQEGGQKFYSRAIPLPDVVDNREKIAVQYVLDAKIAVGVPFKVKVDFKCEQPVTLPEIDLVCGFPRPLNKNSGTVIGTLPGAVMKKKMFKDGYYATMEMKVSGAHSVKDKIVLFLHSDLQKGLVLKPVIKL